MLSGLGSWFSSLGLRVFSVQCFRSWPVAFLEKLTLRDCGIVGMRRARGESLLKSHRHTHCDLLICVSSGKAVE